MAYVTDWVAQRWIVISSTSVPDLAAGNRLKFEGDGSTPSINKLTNLSTEKEWAAGFTWSNTPEKVAGTRTTGSYDILYTARSGPNRATIKYVPSGTGGASWTAQEGG
jgi:hypothetical protein